MTTISTLFPAPGDGFMFVILFFTVLGIIGLSEFLRIRFNWSPESTRKLVHVLVGFTVSCSPFLFAGITAPLILAILFILLNGAALKKASFSGMHGTDRISYGTVFFPLSYLLLVLAAWSRPFTLMLGLLMMTFADTAGSIIGQAIRQPKKFTLWKDVKTLEGSGAVFGTGFLITLIMASAFRSGLAESAGELLLFALVMASVVTLAEAVSNRGSDNLSVPLLTALTADLFIANRALGQLTPWLIWIVLSIVLVLASVRLKALSPNGGVAAFFIGFIIFGSGGIPWILPLILFFVFSSMLSKLGKHQDTGTQKDSHRDLFQVLANGGIAALIAGIHFYFPSRTWLYPVFLGSLAAAAADTWATEIGFFSRRTPRHILTGIKMEKGMSGGVTFLGFCGAFLGAGMISVIGWFYGLPWQVYAVIFLAGILGSMIDSILGGTLQALYRHEDDGSITEEKPESGRPAHLIRGWRWMDNNMVNLINTFCGALITLYIFL